MLVESFSNDSKIDELSDVMTGEESIQNNFGNIKKNQIRAFLNNDDARRSLDLFCDNLEGDLKSIYFVVLKKHNESAIVEGKKIIGKYVVKTQYLFQQQDNYIKLV